MSQDRFYELVSLKLSGEAEPAELAELESFLQSNPEEGLKLEALMNIWNVRHSNPSSKKDAFNRHMQRLSNHLSEPVLQYEDGESETGAVLQNEPLAKAENPLGRLLWIGGVAASLAIGYFVFLDNNAEKKVSKTNANNIVSTKRGSKSKVTLPDGSDVWLNADSRITYKEDFTGATREVNLTGEAYFDVVRDETRPFIIHTDAIDVKVLGTAFNIRSYANERNTETSLIRGSVEITLVKSPDKKKIILKPNDKLIVNNNQPALTQEVTPAKSKIPVMTLGKINYKMADSAAVETLWVMNKLAFDDDPLEEIAMKIERWYDVTVSITDEKLKKEAYTATFEDKTLKEVMEALRTGGGFQYSISKKEVVIRR